MIHKYTLSCIPGRMGKTDRHYLRLGEWLQPRGELVLAHGIMTELEYQFIVTNEYVRLYAYWGNNWIGIYNRSGSARWLMETDGSNSIGLLRRTQNNVFEGYVHFEYIGG